MEPCAGQRADPDRAVLRPPPAAAPRAGDPRPALGRRLPRLAHRVERRRGQPARLRHAAGDRDLRHLGARHPGLVLLVAAPGHAPDGDAGALGRRLRLHLRRADRGGRRDPGRLPLADLPAHHLPARRRPARGDARAGRAGRRPLPDPPRQLARQGGQHQRRPAAHRRRTGADARRRPRADARRARRDGRLLRRRAHGPGPEPARLLQPRLGPALRRRPPRAVALLPRRLPRQGPPRRRLLVRLGGADPPRGAARDRRRRDRDDRRGLPHHDPHAAPRLEEPLPRRGSWSRGSPPTTSTATCCSATAGRAATSPSSPCPSPPCAPASCAPCSACPTSPASPPTWRRRCACCCSPPSAW